MNDRELADTLLADSFTATAALIALILKNPPDEVRTRTIDAVRNGTGKVELRTRVESDEAELVLVPFWMMLPFTTVLAPSRISFSSVLCRLSVAVSVPYLVKKSRLLAAYLSVFIGGR